jgi:hypothetical protein
MLEGQNNKSNAELVEKPEIPEMENLVDFFDLLIVVDRRLNPETYD